MIGWDSRSRALAKFRKRSNMMISAQRIMRKTHSLTIEEALGEKGRPGSDLGGRIRKESSDAEEKAELERALRIFSRFHPSPQRAGNSLAKQRWQRAYSSVLVPHTNVLHCSSCHSACSLDDFCCVHLTGARLYASHLGSARSLLYSPRRRPGTH